MTNITIRRGREHFSKGSPLSNTSVEVWYGEEKLASAFWPTSDGSLSSSWAWSGDQAQRVHAGPDDHSEVIAILQRVLQVVLARKQATLAYLHRVEPDNRSDIEKYEDLCRRLAA